MLDMQDKANTTFSGESIVEEREISNWPQRKLEEKHQGGH